jgi:transcription-repair coupling factor (superfamily II helicase)
MDIKELEPEYIKKREKILKTLPELKSLKENDYVVHIDHGIGIFKGIKEEQEKKYFEIEYAPPSNSSNPDKLLVPIDKGNKLSLYYGFDKPTIHRLSTQVWFNTKKKIKEDLIKLAGELLRLYAKVNVAKAPMLEKDEYLEDEFRKDFDYEETSDQEKAIMDVLNDLEKPEPMDRLVLGDVGFGKTEVALRAAFRAVINKKQVILLAPTTILAKQHFEVFNDRMKKFDIKVSMLSRIQKPKEVQLIFEGLEKGDIDIVIGTHKLLNKNIKFKELGLLIIDEEQRFGVKQKEKLRDSYENVHILNLSATPIPRTLHMALSGFKKISNILTPPVNRQEIKTYILSYDDGLVVSAIENEIKRGGQVFYIHNRVVNIYNEVKRLRKLLPNVKIDYLHGRLPENQILKVMNDFKNNKIDVLVTTVIVENGLDLDNVNTLIVDDATRFGLSQSYQLRGRIGRGIIKAYAYFLHSKDLKLRAKQRLNALKEANYLGAGYQIAMKDLELRGSGNILGKEQSGNINKIGLNLYCQMLNEAIDNLTL